MYTDNERLIALKAAAQRLERFLEALEPDDWDRPSACEGWTVADVVAHLVERGAPIPDQITRGLAGDTSPSPGTPSGPPTSEDQFREDLDHGAVELRRSLGVELAAEFAALNRRFGQLIDGLKPEDWDTPCYHRLRLETVRSKVDIRLTELAMHEWDIRWAFDRGAEVPEDSLPGMVNTAYRAARRAFRPDANRTSPVRYRFEIGAPVNTTEDIVLSSEGVVYDPSPQGDAALVFRSDTRTYVMTIFGRLKMDDALAGGAMSAEGDSQLINDFVRGFVGG
jgi:uncharacterized protein (TIGR03083 family)